MKALRPRSPLWSRYVSQAALALACAVCAASPAAAQSRDRGIDLTISPGGEYSQRFSWLHWWETERSAQQRFALSEVMNQWTARRAEAVNQSRDRLVETLVPLVTDRNADPYARSGAVLALARMGHEDLVDLVVSDDPPAADAPQVTGPDGQPWPVGLVGDPSSRVRSAAWLSLGILDTAASRAKLADDFVWAVTEDDQIARVAAFGFLKQLTSEDRSFLMKTMRFSQTGEVQRMALWALDQHDSPENDKVMQAAISELRSPYSVSEALLSEGPMRRLDTHRLLYMIIANPNGLDDLTVFNHIERGTVWQSSCTFGVSTQLTNSALFALMRMEPAEGRERASLRNALIEKMTRSLALPSNGDRVRNADANGVNVKEFIAGYDRGPAALALAMQTTSSDLTSNIHELARLLDGHAVADVYRYPLDEHGRRDESADPVLVREEVRQREHPVRGYAAVAMGLMLQRMNPNTLLGQEQPLRPRTAVQSANIRGDLNRPLLKALGDRSELTDVRCAAAIALGLSGDASYREPLNETLGTLEPGDAALYGYIVESLGMLDDPRVPDLVAKYFKHAEAVSESAGLVDDNDLLARRALASALVFCGHTSPSIDAELIAVWDDDPWAALALGRASAVRGGGEMIGFLIDQLGDPDHAQAAAMCLADAVDTQSPWRLSPLTERMNYTLDYRVPIELGWNAYEPTEQTGLPSRTVPGFENAFMMHNLLLRRYPQGASFDDLVNDDSNGSAGFIFSAVKRSSEDAD